MKNYDVLAGIDYIGFKDDSNQKLLQDINSFLEQYYDKIRNKVKEQELKNQLSFTLITKILMRNSCAATLLKATIFRPQADY